MWSAVVLQLNWAIGSSFEVLMAYIVIPTLGWRYLVGFSALPMIITVACIWVRNHRASNFNIDLTLECSCIALDLVTLTSHTVLTHNVTLFFFTHSLPHLFSASVMTLN